MSGRVCANMANSLRFSALLAGLALLAAACGGGATQAIDIGERPDIAPAADSASSSPLPPVTVWDVQAEDWVQFADLLPGEKPLLVWFWAPHCSACAAEAPDMVEFSNAHGDDIEIVGLGTQDDPAMAAEFVERHDIPFRMLWDETFETWRAFGITAQPASYLLSADGEVLGGWLGALPEQEILTLTA